MVQLAIAVAAVMTVASLAVASLLTGAASEPRPGAAEPVPGRAPTVPRRGGRIGFSQAHWG